MGPVPWSALGGDTIEDVVSNLLYHEYPRAQRIRPSQGDYGIDIIVPRMHGDTEVWDVYQIKKFALNLTDNQNKQVEKSFRRLMIGLVRRGIQAGDWYLVMPLDPTTQSLLDWFKPMPKSVIEDMAPKNKNRRLPISAEEKSNPLTEDEYAKINSWYEAPDRKIEWKGDLFVETLASKYWFVIDYYLNNGSERIRNAVAEVAKILQRDLTFPVSADDSTTPNDSRIEADDRRLVYLGELAVTIDDRKVNIPGVVESTFLSAKIEFIGDTRARAVPHLNNSSNQSFHAGAALPEGDNLFIEERTED